MSSADAIPSLSTLNASLANGTRIRLNTNPGRSRALTVVFYSLAASFMACFTVSSEVLMPSMISNKGIRGGGMKK